MALCSDYRRLPFCHPIKHCSVLNICEMVHRVGIERTLMRILIICVAVRLGKLIQC